MTVKMLPGKNSMGEVYEGWCGLRNTTQDMILYVILRYKTKLAASLARFRIKHNLLSIECILPESVKMKQERSSSLPLYAWVNTLKSRSAKHTQTYYTHRTTLSHIQNKYEYTLTELSMSILN